MKYVLKIFLPVIAAALILSIDTFADTGADTFKAKCAPCHGATGAGDTRLGKNLKIPDMRSADAQNLTDDALTTIIVKGKGKMPAYEGKLTKEKISELVKFIHSLKK